MSRVVLTTYDYELYLKTEHWQRVRREALDRAGNRCAVCNSSGPLDVHHRTYERLGREEPGDVIALCRDCHELFHENKKLTELLNDGR